MAQMYKVLELKNGAREVLRTKDLSAAKAAYDSLDHGMLLESVGVDENGDFIPGQMADNNFLARK